MEHDKYALYIIYMVAIVGVVALVSIFSAGTGDLAGQAFTKFEMSEPTDSMIKVGYVDDQKEQIGVGGAGKVKAAPKEQVVKVEACDNCPVYVDGRTLNVGDKVTIKFADGVMATGVVTADGVVYKEQLLGGSWEAQAFKTTVSSKQI